MIPNLTLDYLAKFWSRVDKTDGCWLWQATKIGIGYGTFSVRGKIYVAHRFSFILHNGEIPTGMECCHKCDVPGCVHPDHLFLGTHTDNMRDCEMKGRNRHGFGSESSNARTTESDVRRIREDYASGRFTQMNLASKYEMDQTSVSLIVRRKIWKHVT